MECVRHLIVGRTPWSARGPRAPPVAKPSKPTRASAADLGVRPTKTCATSDKLVLGSIVKTAALRIFAIGVGVVLLPSAYTRIHSAAVMTDAAKAFLASLTPQQRSQATFQFQDDERFDWHYIPKPRKGLAMRDMTTEQKQLAHALLAAGLSQQGYIKAVSIMSLDQVLKVLEGDKGNGPQRDPAG